VMEERYLLSDYQTDFWIVSVLNDIDMLSIVKHRVEQTCFKFCLIIIGLVFKHPSANKKVGGSRNPTLNGLLLNL